MQESNHWFWQGISLKFHIESIELCTRFNNSLLRSTVDDVCSLAVSHPTAARILLSGPICILFSFAQMCEDPLR
mgnify:FL=1